MAVAYKCDGCGKLLEVLASASSVASIKSDKKNTNKLFNGRLVVVRDTDSNCDDYERVEESELCFECMNKLVTNICIVGGE